MIEEGAGQEPNSRITREHAERAEMVSKKAWSETMDRIVESRAQQGDYFVKIGEKRENNEAGITETDDQRIIAFRKPVMTDDTGHPNHVVITQYGPYAVTGLEAPHSRFDIRPDEFIKRMEEIRDNKNEGSYMPPNQDAPAKIHTFGYGSHGKTVLFNLSPITDDWTVRKAIEESVKEAESPHKARLESANAKADMAKTVGSFVSELPPR